MAVSMKAEAPTEGTLIVVDEDAGVRAAAELSRTLAEREQVRLDERRALQLAVHPDTFGSADHRVALTDAELITAHDRLRELTGDLRALRVTREAAEARLRAARTAAYERAEPVARAHLAPLLAAVWDRLVEAADAQSALEQEAERLNRALGQVRFQFLGWPDLRNQVDDRRRRSP